MICVPSLARRSSVDRSPSRRVARVARPRSLARRASLARASLARASDSVVTPRRVGPTVMSDNTAMTIVVVCVAVTVTFLAACVALFARAERAGLTPRPRKRLSAKKRARELKRRSTREIG